jgi:hypothetical protein
MTMGGRWIRSLIVLGWLLFRPALGVEIKQQPTQPPAPIVLGSQATLQVEALPTAGGVLRYQWRVNGVPLPGPHGATRVLNKFSPADGGRYDVRIAELKPGTKEVLSRARSFPVILIPEVPLLPFSDGLPLTAANELKAEAFVGRGDNVQASVQRSNGEPLHADARGGASVWLRWRAPRNGVVRFRTAGSGFDTVLAVYTLDQPGVPRFTDLKLVAANDERGPFHTSDVAFNARADRTYFVAIDGHEADRKLAGRGPIVLAWGFEPGSGEDFLQLPTFPRQPGEQQGERNEAVTLSFDVNLGNADSSQIQWFRNGLPVNGANEPTLTFPQLRRAVLGTYHARVVTRNQKGDSRTNFTDPVQLQVRERGDGGDPTLRFWDRYARSRADGVEGRPRGAQPAAGQGRLQGMSRGTSGTQIASSETSTSEEGEPALCSGEGGGSLWYSLYALERGVLVATTKGSDYDTVLSAFTEFGADGETPFDDLREVACNDDAEEGSRSSLIAFKCRADTIYSLAVDSADGTYGAVQLEYEFHGPLEVFSTAGNFRLRAGSPLHLAPVINGYGTKVYQWFRGANALIGQNGPVLDLPGVTGLDAGAYRLDVANEVGESVSVTVANLEVETPPVITGPPVARTVNEGEFVTLSVTATGTPPLTYRWLRNGGEVTGAITASYGFRAVAALAGEYTVEVSNGAGRQTSVGARLSVEILRLGTVTTDAGGTTHLQVIAAPGSQVRVEVSPDLRTWREIAVERVGPTGLHDVSVPPGDEAGQFIRLVLP